MTTPASTPGLLGRLWNRTEPVSAALVAALVVVTIWPARELFATTGWWAPALLMTAVLVGTSALVRLLTGSAVLGTLVQFLLAVVWLLRSHLSDTLVFGVLPTPSTAGAIGRHGKAAADLLANSTAPVPNHPSLDLMLLAVIALVVVLTDAAVHTVRSVLIAAVPPLLVFVVLAANRTETQPVWWFLALAACWAALLALHHSAETAGPSGRGLGVLGAPGRGVMLSTAAALTVVGVVAALTLPSVLPEREQRLVGRGLASDTSLATVGFTETMDLESDLNSTDERPVILWHTDAEDPGPLRVTSTNRFVDDRWEPQRGRSSQEILDDPRAVDGAVADRLPRVEFSSVLKTTREEFAVTANGIPTPFLATPSFPVDLRSPVEVTGDPVTDAVWISQDAARYEGAGLEPTVPDELPAPEELQGLSDGYTAVPAELKDTISSLNEQVVTPDAAPLDQAREMQAYLRNGDFEYSLDAAEPRTGESMVQAFLRERRGYCTHYATTMIMMAREQGIPARLAMGMLPGSETDGDVGRGSDVGPERLVKRSDAHAWPELYFQGVGWLRFEPTPSERSAAVPAYSQPTAAPSPSPSPSEASPSPSEASPSPSESSATPSQSSPSPSSSKESSADEGGQDWWKPVLGVLAALVLLALALCVLPWRARRAREAIWQREQSPWSAAWEALRLDLLDRGVTTRSTDSVREQARHVLAQREHVDTGALQELAERVEHARYARPDDAAAAADARGQADALREQVLASVDAHEGGLDRLRRRLFPASATS